MEEISSDEDDPFSHDSIVKQFNKCKAKCIVEGANEKSPIPEVLNLDSESSEDAPSASSLYPRTRSQTQRTHQVESSPRNKRQVATIDLEESGSPLKKVSPNSTPLDITIDVTLDSDSDDNVSDLEEEIKIIWNGNSSDIHRFTFKKNDTLKSAFEHFAAKEDCKIENVQIKRCNYDISMYDTVQSLSLKVTDVLEASIATEKENIRTHNNINKLELKCIMKDRKKPLVFHAHPSEPMENIFHQCAEELSCSVKELRLKFDGEYVEHSDTPESLGLFSGECLDLYFKPL